MTQFASVNGQEVHNNAVNRRAVGYQEWVSVDLEQGGNHLLVAVYQAGGGWSGFFGFDADYSIGNWFAQKRENLCLIMPLSHWRSCKLLPSMQVVRILQI